MNSLSFFVPGEPQPKQRPRRVRNKYTGRMVTYTPKPTLAYEHKVKTHALRAAALGGWKASTVEYYALTLDLLLASDRWKDMDNLIKSVFDGLQPEVIPNDRYIFELHVRMFTRIDKPGVRIELKRITLPKWEGLTVNVVPQ